MVRDTQGTLFLDSVRSGENSKKAHHDQTLVKACASQDAGKMVNATQEKDTQVGRNYNWDWE